MLDERLEAAPSPRTLNSWVDGIGGRVPTPLELSARLRPDWGGVLGVDGKALWVRGEEHCLLVGVDQTTQDVVHRLVLEAETAEGLRRLVHEAVVEAGYPLRGLVTDAAPGWVETCPSLGLPGFPSSTDEPPSSTSEAIESSGGIRCAGPCGSTAQIGV